MRILGAEGSINSYGVSMYEIPVSYLRDGDICIVKDTIFNRISWYRYEENSFLTQTIPTVIIPKDNLPPSADNGGRWIICESFYDTVYSNVIRTNTLLPGSSGDSINIYDVMTVTPSGAYFTEPIHISVDNIPPHTEPPMYVNTDKMVVNLNANYVGGYPISDIVVKEYGSTSLPYNIPSGFMSPSAGPRWIYISFNKKPKNDNYMVATSIVNTVDPDPSQYATTITEKTTAGFKVLFSGDIDSPNYKLEYMAIGDFE